MPKGSVDAARFWIERNIVRRKPRLGILSALPDMHIPPLPAGDPREGDPNWKMTQAEVDETLEILRQMKADGAEDSDHPKHQAFCDGIRLITDRGPSFKDSQSVG